MDFFNKKLAYPYECFNSLADYQKPFNNSQREDFLNNLKVGHPADEDIERTEKLLKFSILKTEKN